MAINIIQNVTVDDDNLAFGGFIYNIDYQANGGESSSTLKLTLINEDGNYFIEPEDLRTTGSPTKIDIGSKISLKMFPISYRFEHSSVGRLLEVEYIDEGITFLDKKYVGLNQRQQPNPNVILVGRSYIRQSAQGITILEQPENTFSVKAPEILYTFGELLDKLKSFFDDDFIGNVPEFSGGINKFFKDYTGTLRQVLSAWCNDLGFMFYWENSQLNILDLRGRSITEDDDDGNENTIISDTYEVVKNKVNILLSQIGNGGGVQGLEESYSLRDTISRGFNSTFTKDGEIIRGEEQQKEEEKTINFKVIPATNIPNFNNINSGKGIHRMNMSHYEIDFLLALLMARESTESSSQYNDLSSRGILTSLKLSSGSPIITTITANLEGNLEHNVEDYHWWEVSNLEPGRFRENFEIYRNFSNFIGRYFYTSRNFDPELNFESNDIVWYDKDLLVKHTILNEFLEPVSEYITNYDTLSLKNLINDNASFGYYIKEITPEWSPKDSESIFNSGNMVIIEGNTNSTIIPITKTIVGIWKESSFEYSQISRPTLKNLDIEAKIYKTNSLGGSTDSINWFTTSYPPKFSQTNAMNIDIIYNSIPEDLIISQNLLTEQEQSDTIFETLDRFGDNISPALALGLVFAKSAGVFAYKQEALDFSGFIKAHNLVAGDAVINQEKPFFSKSFTVPYIDLPTTPLIGDGLQSIDISVGEQGIQVKYTFGTENMKIRSSEFYLQNYYDSKTKAVLNLLTPNSILANRGRYKITG